MRCVCVCTSVIPSVFKMSFLAGRLRLLPGMVRKVSKSQVITRRNMPSCAVDANFPIPKGFEVKLSRKLADMLNKPERV